MNNSMIIPGRWNSFVTLEGERLLLVKRSHPFLVFLPIVALFILALLLLAILFFLFIVLTREIQLFIAYALVIFCLLSTFVMKCLLDWHFHLYIITSRKLIEVWYTPLYSYIVNDILLDSVNCTQIDVQRNGLLSELLDMGDIIITFDRPTHQDEFALRNLKGSYPISIDLTKYLLESIAEKTRENAKSGVWYRYPRKG